MDVANTQTPTRSQAAVTQILQEIPWDLINGLSGAESKWFDLVAHSNPVPTPLASGQILSFPPPTPPALPSSTRASSVPPPNRNPGSFDRSSITHPGLDLGPNMLAYYNKVHALTETSQASSESSLGSRAPGPSIEPPTNPRSPSPPPPPTPGVEEPNQDERGVSENTPGRTTGDGGKTGTSIHEAASPLLIS